MKPKKTKQQEIDLRKQKARDLFRAGYTTREIGRVVGRSHAWVALAVRKKS